ncbi:MAG TPA: YtxH domain-containing protein [Thermodesulfobacteriota bacterium]|nr:YtxH domain-containing protein [Thermodesulfobacteriota bacterium]
MENSEIEKTNPETEKTKSNQGRVLGGFILGGLIGGLAGLIFAPKAGRELRADIKAKGIEAKKMYDDSVVRAKNIVDDAKNRAAELIKEAERQLSEARMKARDVLSRQEKADFGQSKEKDEPRA